MSASLTSPARVRIHALGSFRLVVDGRELRLRTRKEAMLLLRLTLAGAGGITRDECIDMLWPESSEARARHSLSEALRGIEMATGVEVMRTADRLALAEGAVAIDTTELDAAIAAGDVHACARIHVGGFLSGWYPPTAEASHWVDAHGAGIAGRLERMLRRQLVEMRQATDSRGVREAVTLLEKLGVATNADLEAAAEAEQITSWESLRPGEAIEPRIPPDREGPFVGRVEEMKLLTAELERALAGEVRVVLVSGEAGIGKTRTCQRLARLAALRGCRLFMSKCYELEQSVPFGALGEALDGTITTTDLAQLKPIWQSALRDALPSLGVDRDALGPSDATGQSVYAAFAALLTSVAGTRTGFLLIDDLQWADATSCQVLHYMLRVSQPAAGICVVLSYRSKALEANPAASALVRAADARGCCALVLRPMSIADIRRQLGELSTAPVERLDSIALLAAGNPFFARELAMADAHEALTGQRDSLERVILSRADRVTDNQRLLLDVLSVVGSPIPIIDLARVVGQSVPRVARALVRLEGLQLTVEQNGNVLIAHDITRQAFYSSLSPLTRRSLHAAAGLALVDSAQASLLAHHFLQGGMPQQAHEQALIAAKQCQDRMAFAEEVDWLVFALSTVQKGRAAFLEQIVTRLFALAKYAEAVDLIEAWTEAVPLSLAIKAEVGRLKGTVISPENYDTTLSRCEELFRLAVANGLGFDAVEALRERMRFAQEAADTKGMLQVAERLHDFGWQSEDASLRAQAVGISLMKLTSYQPSIVRDRYEKLRDSVREPLDRSTRVTVEMVDALDLYNQGNILEAGKRCHELLREARSTGNLVEEVRLRTLLVPISTEAGRFHRAHRHASFVFEYTRFADARWERLMTLLNLASCSFEQGDYFTAQTCASQALEAGHDYPMWLMAAHALGILGLCALRRGDFSTAVGYGARIEQNLPPTTDWLGDVSYVILFLARLRDAHGNRVGGLALVERALAEHSRAPRVFYWTLELERLRLSGTLDDERMRQVRRLQGTAAAKGCRLIQRKAETALRNA